MAYMQVCMGCPLIDGKLTPTDIFTLLGRRPDPNKDLDVTEFLAAATPIIAKIPADGGNDAMPNAKEFYSNLASMVAEYKSIVAELAELGQSGQKSVLDLRRMRKQKNRKLVDFENFMNDPFNQNCGKCVSDALRDELWAYINFPTANPASSSDSSSGSTGCRDPHEEPTSPTEIASRPTKRHFSQTDSSATHLDQQRRVKRSLEVRGVSLDPPKTTNNPGESSSVQQQPLQHPLPRIQLPPQTKPLPRIPYQPAYAGPGAGVQHAPSQQLASPYSALQDLDLSGVGLPQLDAFYIALQSQNAEAVPHHPVVRHAVPEFERPPSHAYYTVVPDRHHDMPRPSTQQQWEAPWNDAYMPLTPAPPTMPGVFTPARRSAFDPVRDSALHNAYNSAFDAVRHGALNNPLNSASGLAYNSAPTVPSNATPVPSNATMVPSNAPTVPSNATYKENKDKKNKDKKKKNKDKQNKDNESGAVASSDQASSTTGRTRRAARRAGPTGRRPSHDVSGKVKQ